MCRWHSHAQTEPIQMAADGYKAMKNEYHYGRNIRIHCASFVPCVLNMCSNSCVGLHMVTSLYIGRTYAWDYRFLWGDVYCIYYIFGGDDNDYRERVVLMMLKAAKKSMMSGQINGNEMRRRDGYNRHNDKIKYFLWFSSFFGLCGNQCWTRKKICTGSIFDWKLGELQFTGTLITPNQYNVTSN